MIHAYSTLICTMLRATLHAIHEYIYIYFIFFYFENIKKIILKYFDVSLRWHRYDGDMITNMM